MRIVMLGNFGVDHSSETHHANTLNQLGHDVARLQETQATADDVALACVGADLFIWVMTHGWQTPGDMAQTLHELAIPSMSYHLDRWLGLARQAEIGTDAVFSVDHWFTVDRLQADWLNQHTSTTAHYLPAGVYGAECYMAERPDEYLRGSFFELGADVIFVGSRGYHPEYSYRPKLIDWLKDTYGPRFRHYGGDGLGTIRGHQLNQLYANTKVVVGDSLTLDGDDGSYWSDRVYETIGRGGMLIHPYLEGLATLAGDQQFIDTQHIVYYTHGDFDELKFLIDWYLDNDTEREQIRKTGHEHVKTHHTYTQRWQSILKTLKLT